MSKIAQPQAVHLVGSVPLENGRNVFEMSSSILGNHLHRIPDGETNERTNWIAWQFQLLDNTPQLDRVDQSDSDYGNASPQVRLRKGVHPQDIELGPLGYSAAAKASYATFSKLKSEGKIPAHCRFQVSLPTPLAPINFYVVMADRAAIEPVYETKLLAELGEILAAIPASELAIQWDTAVEFGILEGVFPSHLQNAQSDIMARLVRLGDAVPAEVELGYHLCYGDSGHKHFVEPKDATHLVNVANGIANGINRPLNWIHLPIPKERDDEAFFSPLKSLHLHAETELYLGLIHMTDGVDGAERRIKAAQSAVKQFGVATECGFGRRPADTIPDLMTLHTAVSQPIN